MPMLRIASWNVNSLNVRLPHVLAWCDSERPDVLALQDGSFLFATLGGGLRRYLPRASAPSGRLQNASRTCLAPLLVYEVRLNPASRMSSRL